MSRSYINIFLEKSDEITVTSSQGKSNLHLGGDVTIFLTHEVDLGAFVKKVTQLYEDAVARKEARNAREERNGEGEARSTRAKAV